MSFFLHWKTNVLYDTGPHLYFSSVQREVSWSAGRISWLSHLVRDRNLSLIYRGTHNPTYFCSLPWGSFTVPPKMSSSCQCMYFWEKPWQPPVSSEGMCGFWQAQKEESVKWVCYRYQRVFHSKRFLALKLQPLNPHGALFCLRLIIYCKCPHTGYYGKQE